MHSCNTVKQAKKNRVPKEKLLQPHWQINKYVSISVAMNEAFSFESGCIMTVFLSNCQYNQRNLICFRHLQCYRIRMPTSFGTGTALACSSKSLVVKCCLRKQQQPVQSTIIFSFVLLRQSYTSVQYASS